MHMISTLNAAVTSQVCEALSEVEESRNVDFFLIFFLGKGGRPLVEVGSR